MNWLEEIYAVFAPAQIVSPVAFWLLFAVRISLFVCVLAAIVYYGIAVIAGLAWFADRRRQRALGQDFTTPVTILKPVRGVDYEAYQNFASFCRQDYTDFQIIFGVREESDPVVPLIRKLMADFPRCDIELVISAAEIGLNAKVSNLHNMLAGAKHGTLLIADSDIRVGPDYLRRVVAPLRWPGTGMVTCLYRGTDARSVAAWLENIGISATFGPEVCTSRLLEGVAFAFGSTMVMRRETLERIGGFAAVADYLADDFLLGKHTADLGYEVVLSDYVVEHASGQVTLAAMLRHQLRWARAIRASRPGGYKGLFLTYGTVSSLAALLAWNFSGFACWLLAATMLFRFLPVFAVGVYGLKDYALARYFWLVPIRDLITFGVWVVSFMGDKVRWRGADFRILPGGKLSPPRRGA